MHLYGATEGEAPAQQQQPPRRSKLPLAAAFALASLGCAGAFALSSSRAGGAEAAAPDGGARAAAFEALTTIDDDALDYFESLGCGYEDDDSYFLSDTGCIDGDAYTCADFLTNNSAYGDSAVPFFGANESCAASCSPNRRLRRSSRR